MAGSVQDVDRLTHTYYNSPDSNDRQQAYEGLQQTMQDIGTLLHVMEESRSQYSYMFVTLSLPPCFKQAKNTLSPQLIDELLNRVLRKVMDGTGDSYKLIHCLAQLQKLCFEAENTTTDTVIAQCVNAIDPQNGTKADPNTPHFHAAVELLADTVNEMNLFDSKKSSTYMSFVQHRRASNGFRDKCLFNVLQCATNLLARSEGPMGHIVELVRACLNFDFMAILVDETEESMTTQFPATWKDALLGDFTMPIWQKHLELPPPYCNTLLQGLSGIFGCRRSLFDDQKTIFIDRCLNHVTLIEKCSDGRHGDEQYCGILSEAIVRMTPPFAYRDMIDCPSYDIWLEFVANFSIKMFGIPFGDDGSLLATCTLLTFWSRMINSRKMHYSGAPLAYGALSTDPAQNQQKQEEEQRQDLERFCPALAGTFFQCRLTTTGSGSFDKDSVESIIAQAELFPALCNVDPANTIMSLIQGAENIGGPSIATNDDSFTWLMYLSGAIVRSCLAQHSSKAGTVLAALCELCVGSIKARQSSGRRNTDCVETAIVYFLGGIQSVLSSRHLSEDTIKIRDHAFGSVTGVFQFILTATGHNMLNPSSNAVQIARQSINLIAEAAREAPSSAKKELTFDLPPVVDMPLSTNKETYKLRTPLNNALFSLNIVEPYEQQQLENFMGSIENMMQASASGQGNSMEPLFIGGWLRDLRGVCEAAGEMQVVFTDFIDWVVRHEEVFFSLSLMENADPIIVTSLLRFLNQLVTPSRGGRVNVPSGLHCPSGVILFKFVAQAVQNIITTSLNPKNMNILQQVPLPESAYNILLKPLLISMQICKNCIAGEFCPFGAMAMYNDNSFDTLVCGLCGFLQDFPVILFQQYTHAGVAFSELMKTLVDSQVVSPFAQMTSAELANLIRLSIELIDDSETKTPVLLNCLSFLAYFAGLKKIVMRLQSGQPPSPTLSPTKSSTKHNESIAGSLQSYGENFWWEIVRCSMQVVSEQERGLSAINQIVFPLFEHDQRLWDNYCSWLAEQYPTEKHAKVQEGLEILRQAGGGPQDKFFSAMFQFRSHLRSL